MERLLARDLADAPTKYEVSSAGVGALVGEPMEPHAAARLQALGGDPEGFVARQLEPALVEEADLVLTATERIRQRVLHESPRALRRTFTVREFAMLVADEAGGAPETFEALVADAARRRGRTAGADLDVPDPMGRAVAVHERAAAMAAEAVATIATALRRVSG